MRAVLAVAASLLLTACDHLIAVDVDCDNLCLVAPGPTLPGLDRFPFVRLDAGNAGLAPASDAGIDAPSAPPADVAERTLMPDAPMEGAVDANPAAAPDGGGQASPDTAAGEPLPAVPDGGPQSARDVGAAEAWRPAADARPVEPALPSPSVQWFATIPFSDAIKQLPSQALDLSVNIRIAALRLVGTTDLSFVDSVDVFLEPPGGTRFDASMPATASTLADGGSPVSVCALGAGSIQVARFRRAETAASGLDLPLAVINPAVDLAACMANAPTRFDVRLGIVPTAYPASDVTLSLASCIAVSTHAGYP